VLAAPSSSTRLLGVRVLLVDDDEDARELFALALAEAGAEVRTAVDAGEALRTIQQFSPSIVVSDLSMPTTDGFMLLRQIRREHGQVPAVAVTGLGSPKDRQEALAAGFQAHVTKPLQLDALVAIVKQWAAPAAPEHISPSPSGQP
jgi:CheY-like chemotaxis protein